MFLSLDGLKGWSYRQMPRAQIIKRLVEKVSNVLDGNVCRGISTTRAVFYHNLLRTIIYDFY